MRLYPAIDIKDGKCVRLLKGSFADVTVYGSDPVAVARKWESLGGEFIHVVDLDGAQRGHGVNADIIKSICKNVNVPVQTGGGIRSEEDIEAKKRKVTYICDSILHDSAEIIEKIESIKKDTENIR